MKFKLDENLPAEIVDDLNAAGHEADTVPGEGMMGAPDSAILLRIARKSRVLLTMEKGIADVRVYRPQDYPGIVFLRRRASGRAAVVDFVRRHLPALPGLNLAGRLVVVTDRGIRIR